LLISCDDTARKSKAGESTLLEVITVNNLDQCVRFVLRPMIGPAHLRHNLFENPLAAFGHPKFKANVGQQDDRCSI
jgi:hypothetical protein